MSTYLRPIAEDVYVLAALAEVSVPAYQRMIAYKVSVDVFNGSRDLSFWDRDVMTGNWIEMIKVDGDAYTAYRFYMRGWGNLNARARYVIDCAGLDPDIGSTIDPELVTAILRAMGIELPADVDVNKLDGLKWG
jgi:hypothetical protein